MKVLVIGAGNMGLTYSEGMAKSPLLNRKNLMIHDVSEDLLKKLSEVSYYDTFDNLQDCVPNADVVFLAVKPYHSEELFERMKPMLDEQQIIVSLMAGVTIENIQNGLNVKKVVRTMPNLPAKVGKGVTSYTESKEVHRVELLMNIFYLRTLMIVLKTLKN